MTLIWTVARPQRLYHDVKKFEGPKGQITAQWTIKNHCKADFWEILPSPGLGGFTMTSTMICPSKLLHRPGEASGCLCCQHNPTHEHKTATHSTILQHTTIQCNTPIYNTHAHMNTYTELKRRTHNTHAHSTHAHITHAHIHTTHLTFNTHAHMHRPEEASL